MSSLHQAPHEHHHGSTPTSAQRPRLELEGRGEDTLYEASAAYTIPTKFEDGAGSRNASTGSTEDDLHPISRLSSAVSEFGPGSIQDADFEILARLAIEPTSPSYDLGIAKMIQKPKTPSIEEPQGFKMMAAAPRNSTGSLQVPPSESTQTLPSTHIRRSPSLLNQDNDQTHSGSSSPTFPWSSIQDDAAQSEAPSADVEVRLERVADDKVVFDNQTFNKPEQLSPGSQEDPPTLPLQIIEKELINGSEPQPDAKIIDTKNEYAGARSFPDKKKKTKKKKNKIVYSLDFIENPINISGTLPQTVEPLKVVQSNAVQSNAVQALRSGLELRQEQDKSASLPYASHNEVPFEQNQQSASKLDRNCDFSMGDGVIPEDRISRQSSLSTEVADHLSATHVEKHIRVNNNSLKGSPNSHFTPPLRTSGNAIVSITEQPKFSALDRSSSIAKQGAPPSMLSRPVASRLQPGKEYQSEADTLLHSLSDRAGPVRVIKHAPVNSHAHHPISSVNWEDFFTTIQTKFGDIRHKLMDEVRDSVEAKEAELQCSVKTNEDLAKRLRESRTQQTLLQAQVKKFGATASRLKKFMNGLGNDMKMLGNIRGEIDAVITENKSLQSVHQRQQCVEIKLSKFRHETFSIVDALAKEKAELEQKLSEKAGQLSEEKDRSAVLQRQLDRPREEYCKLQETIKELDCQTSETLQALLKLVGNQQQEHELSRLVHRCLDEAKSIISLQGQNTSDRIEGLTGLIDAFSLATQKQFEESKQAVAKRPDQVADVEARMSVLLNTMKTDILSHEDLAAKSVFLQGSIAKLEEQINASETRVSELNSQAAEYRAREVPLQERIIQLEVSNASLQSERSSSEDTKIRLQEVVTTNSNLNLEIVRMQSEKAAQDCKVKALAVKAGELQRQKEDLQRYLIEKENLISEAHQVVSDFESERKTIRDDSLRDLKEFEQKMAKQAISNQSRHSGELRQIESQKGLVEKKLATALSELGLLKAENQLLKEQAKSNSPKEVVDSLTAEIETKTKQIHRLDATILTERKESEGLQRTVTQTQSAKREVEAAVVKQSGELERLRDDCQYSLKLLCETRAIKEDCENQLGQARTALHEQEKRHNSEISTLRQSLELVQARINPAGCEHGSCPGNSERTHQDSQNVNGVDQEHRDVQQIQGHPTEGIQAISPVLRNKDDLIQNQPSNGHPQRQKRRIDRNQTKPSQGFVKGIGINIDKAQHDEEELLDNRNPNSQELQDYDFDMAAVGNQTLDENGVWMINRQSSHENEQTQTQAHSVNANQHSDTTHTSAPPENMLQARPFATFDQSNTQQSSSSLSPVHSSYSALTNITNEEIQDDLMRLGEAPYDQVSYGQRDKFYGTSRDQAGLRSSMHKSQRSDMSPPVRRSSAMSGGKGKKRDPVQPQSTTNSVDGMTKTGTEQPLSQVFERQSSRSQRSIREDPQSASTSKFYTHKHAGATTAASSRSSDIYDIHSSPVKQGKKRVSPQRAVVGGETFKRTRLNSGSAASPGTKVPTQSKYTVTSKSAHSSASRQASIRSSMNAGKTARKMTRSARQTSKIEERFHQN